MMEEQKERGGQRRSKKGSPNVARFALHNIAGIQNKVEELELRLKDKKIDCCLLTEPLMPESMEMEGYTISVSEQQSEGENPHSQVAGLVWDKTTHPACALEMEERHRGILWFWLVDPGVAFSVIYVPPDNAKSDKYVLELFAVLTKNIAALKGKPYLLAGDFNVPFQQMEEWPEGRNSAALWKLLGEFPELSIQNWVNGITSNCATRSRGSSSSQLDLVLVSGCLSSSIAYFKVSSENLGSDHQMIEFGIRTGVRIHTEETPKVISKFDWKDKRFQDKYEEVVAGPMEAWGDKWVARKLECTAGTNGKVDAVIQKATREFTEILLDSARKCNTKRKKVMRSVNGGPGGQQKLEKDLRKATKERRRALKAWRFKEKEGQDAKPEKNKFLRAADRVEELLKFRKEERLKETWSQVEDQFDNEPGGVFWKEVKRVVDSPKKSLPKCLVQGGTVVSDPASIRQAWINRFCLEESRESPGSERGEFKRKIEEEVKSYAKDRSYDAEEINAEPSGSEVEAAIEKMKKSKAPGADGVVSEMIIFGGDIVRSAVLLLLSMLWSAEQIPKSWRRSIVVPVYKKGSAFHTENYRPISLLSHLLKLYERIIDTRIRARVKIPEEQSGYRKGHGASRQLIRLQQVLAFQNAKSGETYMAFLDLKQAYDRTWREGVFYRLWEAGIRGKCWRVVVDLFRDHQACVETNFGTTAHYKVQMGVLQGSVLSPMLFLIFINPCIQQVKHLGIDVDGRKVAILLFCDDICVLSDSKVGRREILEILLTFLAKWGMQVNGSKSHLVSPKESGQEGEEIQGIYIQHQRSVTYLGVETDAEYVMNRKHVLRKIGAGRKALARLGSLGIGPGKLRPDIAVQLIQALLNSKIMYGQELLELNSNRMVLLDKLQTLAGAALLGLPKCTPTEIVLAECGLVSMALLACRAVLLLANKISSDPDDQLSNHLIRANDRLGVGFAPRVVAAADRLKFSDLSLLGRVKHEFLANFLRKSISITQREEWRRRKEPEGLTECDTWRCKTEWGIEPGILEKVSSIDTAQLIKFRSAQAGLQIDARCRWCENASESYSHVLLKCERWERERRVLYATLAMISPSFSQCHCRPDIEVSGMLLGSLRPRLPTSAFAHSQKVVARFIAEILGRIPE